MTDCSICGGLKKVVQVVNGEPIATRCPKCSDRSDAEDLKRRGVPGRFIEASFDNFIAESSTLIFARDSCIDWCKNQKGWIVLSGPPGVGKTHLLSAIASRVRRSIYVSAVDLFGREKKRIGDKSVIIPDYAEYQGVLLLDELGAGMATNFEKDIIHRIVAMRYDEGLPTAYATNFRVGTGSDRSLERSGRILPHTASRILGESLIIEIDSKDRRGRESE